MESPSERIYRRYKKLNIFDMAYEGKAWLTRTGVFIGTLVFLLIYFKNYNNYHIIQLVLFFALLISFAYYTRKKLLKKYCGNQRIIKQNIGFEHIQINELFNCIKDEKLDSKEGIEHLLKIYDRKSWRGKVTGIAVMVIVLSAVIDNLFNLFIMGKKEDWLRIFDYYQIVNVNLDKFIAILGLLILLVIFAISNIKGLLNLKGMFLGDGYSSLVDVLEVCILPKVLAESHEKNTNTKHVRRRRNYRYQQT